MKADAKIYAVINEMDRAQLELVFQAYELSVSPLEITEDLRVQLLAAYERGEISGSDILSAADYA